MLLFLGGDKVVSRLPLRLRTCLRTTRSSNRAVTHQATPRAIMLQNALSKHNASESRKSQANQIFSSSPSAQRSPTRPLTTASANVVKARPYPSEGGRPQGSTMRRSNGVPSNTGLKRSASGLAKVLSQPAASFVEFDENDIDSDIDLDVEELTAAPVIYPDLSKQVARIQKPFVQPTKVRAAPHSTHHHQDGEDQDTGYLPMLGSNGKTSQQSHPSSSAFPWSSSPVEHMKKASAKPSMSQYGYKGEETRSTASQQASQQAQNATQPQKKRRKLPWPTAEPIPEIIDIESEDRTDFHDKQTPGPKKSQVPWNISASAIKEQQKEFRKAMRKPKPETVKEKKVSKVFLSDEQRHVLSLVIEKRKSVFFTGSAGTGKSVLLREIIAGLRRQYAKESDRVAVTASTGLAACNVGGVTLHSFAGIGLGKEPVAELAKKIRRNKKAKHRWMRTKILVIDEISMVDGELFDKLEELARNLRNNGRPFGGIQLVITGDFFQLPPVPDSGRVAKFAFDAATWHTSIDHTIGLHHVFRQKDPEFARMLNEMREGRLEAGSIAKFKTLSRALNFDDEMEATELFPTRAEVDAANTKKMQYLHGELRTFEARDGGSITDLNQRTKLLSNCMAPERIDLKKGAQVMLIKNIDEQLVNGSLGRVVAFMNEATFERYRENEDDYVNGQGDMIDDAVVEQNKKPIFKMGLGASGDRLADTSSLHPLVQFTLPDGTTRQLLCQRESWKIELPNGEIQASRSQIPLILAWALSIHKAQGQTLERVKVNLGKVFEKGQAYVALSRATNMAGLQVLNFDPRKVVAHDKVRNFYAGLSRAETMGAGKKAGGTRKEKNLTRVDFDDYAGLEDYDDAGYPDLTAYG